MSYILDALQKAEAERKLGAVPGIHTPATQAAANTPGTPRMLWPGIALALLAALLMALAWQQPWRTPPSAALPPMPEIAQLAPVKPAPPVPAAAKSLAAPASEQPAARTAPAEKPLKPKAAAVPKTIPEQPPAAASRAAQPVQKAEAVQAIERQGKEPEPLTLRELPEQIQREIPALAIGGYIYSANPAERSVLINNKLLREGDEAAPGLVLEKMMRGSVLLAYKGYRYRMPY